jgi:hypothetical protein
MKADGIPRWCLWLKDISPAELSEMPHVKHRAQFMSPSPASGRGCSLADLYDPLSMPPVLVKAHQALDRAVDACYRKAAFSSDAQRVAFLFERYQQITSLLPTQKFAKARKKKT